MGLRYNSHFGFSQAHFCELTFVLGSVHGVQSHYLWRRQCYQPCLLFCLIVEDFRARGQKRCLGIHYISPANTPKALYVRDFSRLPRSNLKLEDVIASCDTSEVTLKTAFMKTNM